jgi:hypothetical protein
MVANRIVMNNRRLIKKYGGNIVVCQPGITDVVKFKVKLLNEIGNVGISKIEKIRNGRNGFLMCGLSYSDFKRVRVF